jgi:hypothetical protein
VPASTTFEAKSTGWDRKGSDLQIVCTALDAWNDAVRTWNLDYLMLQRPLLRGSSVLLSSSLLWLMHSFVS